MHDLTILLNLGGIAAIALGAVAFLWRVSQPRTTQHADFVLGYPADQFPAHDVVGSPALQALTATQGRLLSIYTGLSPASDTANVLYTFLQELRAIMDLAYRVALVTRAYGQPAQLEQLVSEVQAIEKELADYVIERLLAYEADGQMDLLTRRLEALQQCARDLIPAAESHVPLLHDQHTARTTTALSTRARSS
ncbi:MAG TPA: hypothetical protein VGD58_21205 [Herpetosiphonaceae bacterium]